MSRSLFKVTCLQCHAAFSTPFPQETAQLRCPECAREAPGQDFDYSQSREQEDMETQASGSSPFTPAGSGAFERRGKWILFKCPHCQWAMRIREDVSATSLVDCGRCGLEILPPDPEVGTPATLTRAGALRLGRMTSPDGAEGQQSEARRAAPGLGAQRKTGASPFEAAPTGPTKGAVKALRNEQLERSFRERDAEEMAPAIAWDTQTRSSVEEDGLIQQAKLVRFIMIGVIAALAIIGLFVRFRAPEPAKASAAASRPDPESTDPLLADPFLEKAKALAVDTAALDDWRLLLPHLRHRERVEPLMADYYARHPLVPLKIVEFETPVSLTVAGRRYLQFGVIAEGGERRIVGFEEEEKGGGLTFDWEVYVDIAADQWESFRKERPTHTTALRFAFIRASVAESYFADARIAPEDGVAVRIWFRDREDSLVAVFPKDSYGGTMIDRLGSWDVGKLVIGELAFPAGSGLTDRVDFEHLLQERWLITEEKSDPLF